MSVAFQFDGNRPYPFLIVSIAGIGVGSYPPPGQPAARGFAHVRRMQFGEDSSGICRPTSSCLALRARDALGERAAAEMRRTQHERSEEQVPCKRDPSLRRMAELGFTETEYEDMRNPL